MQNTFPTPLARMLASQVGLHPTEAKAAKPTKPAPRGKVAQLPARVEMDGDELVARLGEFQQLALINDQAVALCAYHGRDLSKSQLETLEKIYLATQGWVKSLGVAQMVAAIQTPGLINNMEPARDLLDRTVGKLDADGGGGSRALHVKVTN